MTLSARAVDGGFRLLNGLHRALWRLSGGRVGSRAYGLDMVELTTIGRRSGRAHSTMLLVPLRDGERLVVVASKGGDVRDPDWFKNVVADPRVYLRERGRVRAMEARVASPVERERLWVRAVDRYPHYERYQRRAGREIPVVVLAPTAPASSRHRV